MKRKMELFAISLAIISGCQSDHPMANVPEEGFVAVEGGKIWYHIAGKESSGIPLLILHGGPGATHDYLLNLEVLSNERPVIFYDQLGCGNADHVADTSLWHAERFVHELHTLVEFLQLKKFHLLGQSWGGYLAIDYIKTYGEANVSSLILSAPLINTLHWVEDQQNWIEQLPDGLKDTVQKYESTGNYAALAYQEAMGVFYSRHLCRLDPWPELLTQAFGKMNAEQYNHMWGPSEFTVTGNLKHADLTYVLQQMKVPCLLTCGEFDEAAPARMQQYQSMMHKCSLHVFDDASHSHHLEAEEAYLSVVRDFLREY